ncbi:DUF3566 domain-containing protein [Streptomyces sp. NPDC056600]|uniref:DUF3566 domain-containing protein n=1 Tax=Streptomyces sp. NPDC056600 TaxID=3345874 RepID=UPI00367CED38
MNGATGAGPTGGETDGGGRGSFAQQTQAPSQKAAEAHQTHGSQGGTVTQPTQPYEQPGQAQAQGRPEVTPLPTSPLPGERQGQQGSAGPYHPPHAYEAGAVSAPPAGAVRRPRTGAKPVPRTRKARLRVAKTDPWSVMKVSFLLSIALGICTVVAAAVLWMVMDAMGVFATVGGTIAEATGSEGSNGFDLQGFLSLPNVLMFTAVIAVVDVVLMTALATLGAFIYNLSAGFVGGVELTLAEDE